MIGIAGLLLCDRRRYKRKENISEDTKYKKLMKFVDWNEKKTLWYWNIEINEAFNDKYVNVYVNVDDTEKEGWEYDLDSIYSIYLVFSECSSSVIKQQESC